MMKHHIDVGIFLSAQGLAFRGHNESYESSNRGNFLELIDMLGNYSSELREFLDHEKITYTSHDPQNQLIKCIFEEVRSEVQNRIEKSNFFSIMMDDTSDISNVEQSAISIRIIHDGSIEEHLLGLIDSSNDQSAQGLTKVLLETLESYKIVPSTCKEKLIGQSYDGAPTMSGELNGVLKLILDSFPFAYYNHCVAHRMSLCASHASNKIREVARFFGIVDKLVSFFRSSPKRMCRLGHNLPMPGDTRWLSRDTAIIAIDSFYENIGTVLYGISVDATEKTATQDTARGLIVSIQNVDFVCLLKLYRKIFEHCTPIITIMQKPTVDPIQVRSMLDDFLRYLAELDFERVWTDTLEADPNFPANRARGGWRGAEGASSGNANDWKQSMATIAMQITIEFSKQLAWRFENVEKFNWINLIHPSTFSKNRDCFSDDRRKWIGECQRFYPFAVSNATSLEHNLDILYGNQEIAILLQKLIKDRDDAARKIKARMNGKRKRVDEERSVVGNEGQENKEQQAIDAEDLDRFEIRRRTITEDETIKEGVPSMQDLLTVIKKTGLANALPHVMTLAEIASVTPLTSVHCERVFSRMKRVLSSSRSQMLQTRKQQLVFLQVEHSLLRTLSKQLEFKITL